MPSPTWNRLKLNWAEDSAFSEFTGAAAEERIPDGVSFEEKNETAFPDQKTGAGKEVDELFRSSNVPVRSFFFEGSEEDRPLLMGRSRFRRVIFTPPTE